MKLRTITQQEKKSREKAQNKKAKNKEKQRTKTTHKPKQGNQDKTTTTGRRERALPPDHDC